MTLPPRPTREQTDAAIIDRAAALFARHGFAHTSLQQIAEAVGYSKAGLLHHFPSKDALREAAQASSRAQAQDVLRAVHDLPAGRDRDLRAIEGFVDATLASPGLTALSVSVVSTLGTRDVDPVEPDTTLWEIFEISDLRADPDRTVRVLTALAGLSVATLAAHQLSTAPHWRERIIAAAAGALDHRCSDATAPAAPHHLVEA